MKTARVAMTAVVSGICCLFVGRVQARDLTFEDRVRAQEAIERVYYSHQLGATAPFEQAVPRVSIEAKLRRSLKLSVALERAWNTPITDRMLERELQRIARDTRLPARLEEIYRALGDDPFLIKETFARGSLVERLARGSFDGDQRIHGPARREAQALLAAASSGSLNPSADDPRRSVIEIALQGNAPRRPLPAPMLRETSGSFLLRVPLRADEFRQTIAQYVVPKTTWEKWWGREEGNLDERDASVAATGAATPPRIEASAASSATCED